MDKEGDVSAATMTRLAMARFEAVDSLLFGHGTTAAQLDDKDAVEKSLCSTMEFLDGGGPDRSTGLRHRRSSTVGVFRPSLTDKCWSAGWAISPPSTTAA